MIANCKKKAEKAVAIARLYLGAIDYAPLKYQQKLYDKLMSAVLATSAACKVSTESALNQVVSEARSRGLIRPTPGKDY